MKNEYIDVALGNPLEEKVINGIYQYDKGIKLRIQGLKEGRVVQIQYAVDGMKETLTTTAYLDGNKWVSYVPNEVLSRGRNVYCYVYISDTVVGMTMYTIKICVIARPKPDSYNNATYNYAFPSLEMYAGDTMKWEVLLYSDRGIPFTLNQLRTFVYTLVLVPAKDVEENTDISSLEPVLKKTGVLLDREDATLQFDFQYSDTINLLGTYIYQIEMKSDTYCKSQQGSILIRKNLNT